MGSVAKGTTLGLVLLACTNPALLILTLVGELKRLELTAFGVVGPVTERLICRSAAGAVIVGLALLKLDLNGLALGNLSFAALAELAAVGDNTCLR